MSSVRANTRSEKALQWIIRQRYLYGVGKSWLGSLDVVLSVGSGLVSGFQSLVLVYAGLSVISYLWGWFLLRRNLQAYEAEYTSLINPVMRRLDANKRRTVQKDRKS